MPLIYLYSHDGEGLGHFRRNLNIAHAACSAIDYTSALLLTGSLYPGLFLLPQRCDYVKIPALQKSGKQHYRSQLEGDLCETSLRIRKDLLRTVVKSAPPDLLIVDKHATGLNGELLPALKWLRQHSPATKVVLGLRDVLDTPEQVQHDWQRDDTLEVLSEYYDRIWIYGDPQVFDTLGAYPFSRELQEKATSVGYLTRRTVPGPVEAGTSHSVVVTVGGGHDGFSVLHAAIQAFRELHPKYVRLKMRLFAGPLMDDELYHQLKTVARPYSGSIRIERFSQRLQKYMLKADAVVSMGGYNSVIECVSLGKPAIIIPRELPRQEQLIRGQAFEARGFIRVVRQGELTGSALTNSLASIFSGQWLPTPASHLNISGLDRVVTEIRQLLETKEAPTAYYAD